MAKRTQAQIEKDYKAIRKAAETAKSFKELEEITGLSHTEIIVSLQKHPRVYARIKKQIEEARNGSGSCIKNSSKEQYIVIDASITSIPDIESILEDDERKIIITSVTTRELSKLQRSEHDDVSARARHLLLMAATQEERFVHKLIRDDLESADDCILGFCLENKDNLTLYTADKEMCNLAKAYFIPVKFFLAEENVNEEQKIITFRNATRIGKHMVVDLDFLNTHYRMVKVLSNGKEYDKGMVELNIGDEILIAYKKLEGYTTFAHNKIIALTAENNCKVIYYKRIYDNYAIKTMNFNPTYKSFLYKFKSRIS